MAEHSTSMSEEQTTDEPVVVVEHLVKQFGKLRAVDDLNMTIHTGETFGLIGPNGSGKTTLIRMLVGLARPTSGTMRVLHERVPNRRVLAQLGYMTQLSALYLDLTAKENLQFFCSLYGLRGKEQGQRIQEILDKNTEHYGVKVSQVAVKQIDLPESMTRAMAKQAEAEREKRAKIIHAEGEFSASQRLADAARVLASEPTTIQLRYLQTLTEIGVEKNTTIIFPVPVDLLAGIQNLINKAQK